MEKSYVEKGHSTYKNCIENIGKKFKAYIKTTLGKT